MPDILVERSAGGEIIRLLATESGSMVISDGRGDQLITLHTRRLPALVAALTALTEELALRTEWQRVKKAELQRLNDRADDDEEG